MNVRLYLERFRRSTEQLIDDLGGERSTIWTVVVVFLVAAFFIVALNLLLP